MRIVNRRKKRRRRRGGGERRRWGRRMPVRTMRRM